MAKVSVDDGPGDGRRRVDRYGDQPALQPDMPAAVSDSEAVIVTVILAVAMRRRTLDARRGPGRRGFVGMCQADAVNQLAVLDTGRVLDQEVVREARELA